MYNACMVNLQIRDISPEERDALADIAAEAGQSTQAYLRQMVQERIRQRRNIDLLWEVTEVGGGYTGLPSEAADEVAAARIEQDRRNLGSI